MRSGSTDGTARLWDAATFEPITVLKHGGNVSKVAFSPDGTRLATACADKAIRLGDLATHQEVAELCGHEFWSEGYGVLTKEEGRQLLDETIEDARTEQPQRCKHCGALPEDEGDDHGCQHCRSAEDDE